ncbi:6-pyruvoyl tetrahydrobiopterin synthase [Zancudomyces culisetae]|uniref:6-pyruvoyl tetrahydrobiopterin synthase n=1 Tax=Zancudomyces culisetae TaxID=1213189 RepID=A0A1R1PU55_ZANCU|nr:6-pyruvoyl tetrahydrobiopterin synthase [Zancudomyces culisetae]|eukprot:OMH84449.1 6-pyruvoyl tetrahydrobiopterin synthase [Zancudomyces culisetae]
MPIGYITRKETFCAAHRLHSPALSIAENIELYQKCNNPNSHGHNYTLFVTLRGEINPLTGMVANIAELKRIIQVHVLDLVDHKNLDLDVEYFRGKASAKDNSDSNNAGGCEDSKATPSIPSTVENLCVFVWSQLQAQVNTDKYSLYKVEIRETDKNSAVYKGE